MTESVFAVSVGTGRGRLFLTAGGGLSCIGSLKPFETEVGATFAGLLLQAEVPPDARVSVVGVTFPKGVYSGRAS
jgi:hypothetical protein